LLPVDPHQADYLSRRLLRATPEEVLIIRDALKPSGKTPLGRSSVNPVGWGKAVSNQGLYDVGIDRAIKHAGKASAYVRSKFNESDGSAFGNVMQTVSADRFRGQRIRLSAQVKAVRVEGDAGLWVRVDGATKSPLSFDNMSNRPIKGTIDWKKYEIILDIPEESACIAFGILMPGVGQIWVDDVAFDLVGKDVPTTDMGETARDYSEADKARMKSSLEGSPKQTRNLDFEEKTELHLESLLPYLTYLEHTPGNSAAQFVLRTLVADKDKRDALIAEYREAIRRRPDDPSAHFLLGFGLDAGAQRDAAIVEYREAIRIKPDLITAYVGLAGVLQDKGDPGAMIAILQRAVEQAPDNAAPRHRLALAHLLAGDREGYRRACAATAERFDFAKGLGVAEAIRACLLTPDALEDFSVLSKIPEDVANQSLRPPFQRYVRGLALYRRGLYERAIENLTAAMKSDSQWHARALNWLVLAMAHHRLGHAEEARSWLEKACDTRGDKARGVKPGEVFPLASFWWDRGDFEMLRREAEVLILKPTLPGGTSAP
jgi:tetratricopeptide (TPR) repeat protein